MFLLCAKKESDTKRKKCRKCGTLGRQEKFQVRLLVLEYLFPFGFPGMASALVFAFAHVLVLSALVEYFLYIYTTLTNRGFEWEKGGRIPTPTLLSQSRFPAF